MGAASGDQHMIAWTEIALSSAFKPKASHAPEQ
jgi:hypothetical protein